MINYDGQSWFDVLIRWQGTVFQGIWKRSLIVFIYTAVTYCIQVSLECNFGYAWEHSFIIGQSLSFLLVFRANSSYLKYQDGRFLCAHFFSSLRNLAMLCCALFNGGHGQYVWNRRHNADGFTEERRAGLDDSFDARASEARADIVRWSLALAIAFRMAMSIGAAQFSSGEIDEEMKWRINFSRMRLRTLLSRDEFIQVDKALKVEDSGEEWRLLWLSGKSEPQVFHQCTAPSMPGGKYVVSTEPSVRQVLVILFFLCQSVRMHANEPYGYKERFLPTFNTILTHLNGLHDKICQAMTSPLPFPYVSLVRTLLMCYLFSLPFFVNYTDGILANVVNPTLMAMALFGIDQIGSELENPFGDDANDLDIQALIMGLEKELLRTLEMAGDVRARDMFTWLPVPRFMQRETTKPFFWYVAVKREVQHLDVPRARRAAAYGGSATGGVRVRHMDLAATPQRTAMRASKPLGLR